MRRCEALGGRSRSTTGRSCRSRGPSSWGGESAAFLRRVALKLFLLWACDGILPLAAAVNSTPAPLKFEAVEGDTLVVQNDYGTVRIRAWDIGKIEGRYWKSAGRQEQLENVEVLAQKNKGRIHVNSFFYSYAGETVSVDLTVPRYANVVVWGANPTVEVVGVRGFVRVHTSTGAIKGKDLSSSVSLLSERGDITFSCFEQPQADIRLESERGRVACVMAANLSFRGWARAGGNLSWNQETPTADRFMERQVGLGGPLCAAVSLRGDVDFRLADSPVAPPADERPAPAETKQSPPAAGPAPDSPTPTGTGVPPAQRTGTAGEESAGVVNTGYKVKVDVDLVHLNVSVRERATNRSVPDLQRDDFEVLEDGVRQTIGRFEPTEAPFHLLLLLDVSGSTQEFLDLIKEASVQFTRQINAQDRIAVAAFNSRLRLHQEFSNDREEIRQSINRIRSGGGTAFYDALAGCLEQHLRHIEGRKAVVVFTDGVDNQLAGNPADGSYITFNQLYRKIEESDSLVYTIFLDAQDGVQRRPTSGRRPPGGIGDILGDILKGRIPSRSPGGAGPDADVRDEARRQLEMIADQTGGRMYYPRRIEDLDDAYSEIADDLRVQYALAYNSTNAERDGKWRKVEVSVLNRPDVAVRTRKGYYAGQPAGASRKLVNRNGG